MAWNRLLGGVGLAMARYILLGGVGLAMAW